MVIYPACVLLLSFGCVAHLYVQFTIQHSLTIGVSFNSHCHAVFSLLRLVFAVKKFSVYAGKPRNDEDSGSLGISTVPRGTRHCEAVM